MRNNNGILLKRGDNFGDFNFGSTIVLVFEAPDNLQFNYKSGDPIRLGQALCSFHARQDIHGVTSKNDNESSSLSMDDSDNSSDEDATLNVNRNEQNLDQQLLIDTVALDAALVEADAIADQEVISCNHDSSTSES